MTAYSGLFRLIPAYSGLFLLILPLTSDNS